MRTAVAADEPDEPELPRIALVGRSAITNYAAGAAATNVVRYVYNTAAPQPWQWQQPPTYSAHGGNADASLAPAPQPWRCPACGTWMAPTVTEHRCP